MVLFLKVDLIFLKTISERKYRVFLYFNDVIKDMQSQNHRYMVLSMGFLQLHVF